MPLSSGGARHLRSTATPDKTSVPSGSARARPVLTHVQARLCGERLGCNRRSIRENLGAIARTELTTDAAPALPRSTYTLRGSAGPPGPALEPRAGDAQALAGWRPAWPGSRGEGLLGFDQTAVDHAGPVRSRCTSPTFFPPHQSSRSGGKGIREARSAPFATYPRSSSLSYFTL